MEKSEAQKLAKDAFKLSKDVSEMHVTSDGTCFAARNDANNHSFGLKDREIHSFKSDDLKGDKKTADAEAKAKADAEAKAKAEKK